VVCTHFTGLSSLQLHVGAAFLKAKDCLSVGDTVAFRLHPGLQIRGGEVVNQALTIGSKLMSLVYERPSSVRDGLIILRPVGENPT
jgi:hypothetical protein